MKSESEILCHVETAIAVIGGKWKPWILWRLYDGVRRFGELHRLTPGITHKMLTQHLRELERDGVIQRKVYEQKPARVEYSFTPYGETLRPILKSLCDWGALHQIFVARNGNPAMLSETSRPVKGKAGTKAGPKAPAFSSTKKGQTN